MEENNFEETNKNKTEKNFMPKHPIIKFLLIGLMAFLGAFMAFYVVTDWHLKRIYDPSYQINQMNRLIQQENSQIQKMINREVKKDKIFEEKVNKIIHVEKTSDAYKIVIDLKPFDNNEKNVEVKTEDNKLTINAAGELKKHNKEKIIRFTQTFIFPDDAKLDEMSKFKDGNDYFIIIPIDID